MPKFESEFAVLHYHRFGEGSAVLLAFHGFGMNGKQFDCLRPALTDRFTVYSFDLFFHGQTVLTDDSVKNVRRGIDPARFALSISAFLDSIGADRFSLLSYSMGSLMALSLIQHIPDRIEQAIFIAPDGIRPNRLLTLGSCNWLINRVFYKLVYSPATVRFLLNQLLRFRYIDEPLFRILQGEFKTVDTRLTCYNAITYHGKLRFDTGQLAQAINNHNIKTYFYFGKHDKLFPAQIGQDFSANLAGHRLTIIDAGHELVNDSLNDLITQHLREHDPR